MDDLETDIYDAEIVLPPESPVSAPLPLRPLDAAEEEAARQMGRPWPPGQSGNPRGRPPKSLSLTSSLKDKLGELCPEDIEKAKVENRAPRTWLQVIVDSTLTLAASGNEKALMLVFDRIDGKAKATVVHEGEVNHKHQHEHALQAREKFMGKLEQQRKQLAAAKTEGK